MAAIAETAVAGLGSHVGIDKFSASVAFDKVLVHAILADINAFIFKEYGILFRQVLAAILTFNSFHRALIG